MSNHASKSSAVSVTIRKAQLADLSRCAYCLGDPQDIYRSTFPQRLRNNAVPQSVRYEAKIKDLKRDLSDPLKDFWVAVEVEHEPHTRNDSTPQAATMQSQVTGFSVWQKPGLSKRERDAWEKKKSEGSTPPPKTGFDLLLHNECDNDLAEKVREESFRVKHELCGDNSWFLQYLFVSPDHQRRGIGAMLIEQGLGYIEAIRAEIEEDKKPVIALMSTPNGEKLYERYGFKEVYRFKPYVLDINEEGNLVEKDISWPLMIKRS